MTIREIICDPDGEMHLASCERELLDRQGAELDAERAVIAAAERFHDAEPNPFRIADAVDALIRAVATLRAARQPAQDGAGDG